MEQPVVYASDVGKSRGRPAGLFIWTGIALLVSGFWVIVQAGNEGAGLGLMAASIATFVLGAAITSVGRASGAADWLRLDGQGLTLVHRGESRAWRWADISAIERRGVLSLTALRYGRALLLRVSHDGLGTGFARPVTVTIGNDYLTPISELEATLRTLRDWAAGRSGHAKSIGYRQVDRPDMFIDRRYAGKPGAGAYGRFTSVIFWLLGVGVVAAAAVKMVVGWPADGQELIAFLKNYDTIRAAAFSAAIVGLAQLLRAGTRGEFLLLSSDGLHLRHKGQRRHWRWRDLRAFELRRGDTSVAGVNGGGAAITFLAKGDGLLADAGPDANASAFTIEDVYDTPLAEVARRIEAWHLLAGGIEMAESHAAQPAHQVVDIRLVSQSHKGAAGAIGWAVLAVLVLVEFAYIGWFSAIGIDVIGTWPIWLQLFGLLLGAAFCLLPLVLGVLPFLPWGNVLRLDADGLAFRRFGLWRRWTWQELLACEVISARLRWSSRRSVLAVFTAPRDDWMSWLIRWCYRLDTGRPIVPIEAAYQAPLEVIAQKIADHRNKAQLRAGRGA